MKVLLHIAKRFIAKISSIFDRMDDWFYGLSDEVDAQERAQDLILFNGILTTISQGQVGEFLNLVSLMENGTFTAVLDRHPNMGAKIRTAVEARKAALKTAEGNVERRKRDAEISKMFGAK